MNRKKGLFLCASAIALCAVFFFCIPCIKVLSVHARLNPEEMYLIKVDSLEGFEISYTHSVNKGRVHDSYEIQNDDTLLLDTTVFVSYGAGIPEPEETPGAVFTVTEDGYVISNLQRHVKKLVMAVGIIAKHGLTLKYKDGDERYLSMTDMFAPQTSIMFEVVHVDLYTYVKNTL